MKVTILANCSRCGEQFIIQGKTGDVVLSAHRHDKVRFTPGDKLVRHSYISGLGISSNGYLDSAHSDIVSFCESCDQAYWKNFNAANDRLKSFWDFGDSEDKS